MGFCFHYDAELAAKQGGGLIPVEATLESPSLGPVVGATTFFDAGAKVEYHWHDHSQFVYAASGTMVVTTSDTVWLVPSGRGVWLPEMTAHAFHMSTPVEMHTLYVLESIPMPEQFRRCCVLQVSPLLKELIDRVLQFESPYGPDSREGRLVAVLLDEISVTPSTTLYAPFPKDQRIQKLARAIAADPADPRSLNEWASRLGASERTIARLFQRDTGMSFVQWRQQVRLLGALEELSRGRPVSEVANTFGYTSTSAFISLFKKNLGTSPGRYFGQGQA